MSARLGKIIGLAPFLALLAGLCGIVFGATVLRSATGAPAQDAAVLHQQLQDYITATDRTISDHASRLDILDSKLEKLSSLATEMHAVQVMALDQQNKIMYALWGMVSAVLGLFAERIFARLFDRKKV